MVAMNSAPTAPVTPTIATTGSLLTFSSIELQTTKKPRTIVGGASVELIAF
jgi:hypothetical protein